MRLSLLFICLFSILGGCAASSSHGVVVPKLISFSAKHQSILPAAPRSFGKGNFDLTAVIFADDDIDDDDDRQSLCIKKCTVHFNAGLAFVQLAEPGNIHRYNLFSTHVRGNLPYIYILQKNLRV